MDDDHAGPGRALQVKIAPLVRHRAALRQMNRFQAAMDRTRRSRSRGAHAGVLAANGAIDPRERDDRLI
jgi:hypothetical protein